MSIWTRTLPICASIFAATPAVLMPQSPLLPLQQPAIQAVAEVHSGNDLNEKYSVTRRDNSRPINASCRSPLLPLAIDAPTTNHDQSQVAGDRPAASPAFVKRHPLVPLKPQEVPLSTADDLVGTGLIKPARMTPPRKTSALESQLAKHLPVVSQTPVAASTLEQRSKEMLDSIARTPKSSAAPATRSPLKPLKSVLVGEQSPVAVTPVDVKPPIAPAPLAPLNLHQQPSNPSMQQPATIVNIAPPRLGTKPAQSSTASLTPVTKVATSPPREATIAASPSVVLRAPYVRPGFPHRYLFVVENNGTVVADAAKIDFRVPSGIVMKQITAARVSSTARHAVVRVPSLQPGDRSLIEIEVAPTQQEFKFDASLQLSSIEKVAQTPAIEATNAGYTMPLRPAAGASIANIANTTDASNTHASASAPQTQYDAVAASAVSMPIAGAKLDSKLNGPVLLGIGESANFSVVVKNPSAEIAKDIVVQLAVPQGIQITVLDREAWVNEENQTMAWEIPAIAAGESATIRYEAIGLANGQQNQVVSVGKSGDFQGNAQLVTLVSE